MTVSYTAEVATCRGIGFFRLLLRWKASVYKLVWLDLLTFLMCYYILTFIYRFGLDDYQKDVFECIVFHCKSYGTLIPLSFVLGFYVSIVMQRWWDQYLTIPWPDSLAVYVSANVHGQDERGRLLRRTVMRYVCLCHTLVMGIISTRVNKRFPTLEHLVDAGLLLDNEKKIIQDMNVAFPRHAKHWLPIVWAASVITRARKEGRIRDDFAVKTIIDELNRFRGRCGVLMFYHSISIPLVYTQVVTLAVYTYFLCAVMGYQWTDEESRQGYVNYIDYYFPVFTTLQFFFYMGWLKVAESMINPFGEDDDDFEVNWMIDRNLQVSYLIVDEMHHEHPQLLKDQYWDEVFPNELPYSNETGIKREPPEQSTAKMDFPKSSSGGLVSVKVDSGVRGRESIDTLESLASSKLLKAALAADPSLKPRSATSMSSRSAAQGVDDEDENEPRLTVYAEPPERSSRGGDGASQHTLMSVAEDDDEFERLRVEREREREERLRQKLSRNLGSSTPSAPNSRQLTPTPPSTPPSREGEGEATEEPPSSSTPAPPDQPKESNSQGSTESRRRTERK